jgi:hypothetical protein
MAVPTITDLSYSGGLIHAQAVGADPTKPVLYKLAVNRGTVQRLASSVVKSGPSGPTWVWTDNWGASSEGPPLWLRLIVLQSDGRHTQAATSFSIPFTAPPVYQSTLTPSGGDDTAALQADINACIALGLPRIYRFPAATTFRCDGYLTADSKTGLTIDMNGGGIQQGICGATPHGHFELTRNTAIVLRNGTITGHYIAGVCDYNTNTNGNLVYGIKSLGNAGAWFRDIVFSNITCDAITINSYADLVAPYSSFVTVENCSNPDRIDRQGMSVISGTDTWFINVTLPNNRFSTWDIEKDNPSQDLQRVVFINPVSGHNDAGGAISGSANVRDLSVLSMRRAPGQNTQLDVRTNAPSNNPARNWFIYDTQSDVAFWAPPGGHADNCQACIGFFLQSCTQKPAGNNGQAVKLSFGSQTVRIMDCDFSGKTGTQAYSDDGTSRDVVAAGNTL